MRKKTLEATLYSPADLVCFMNSPFASWMERLYLENPDSVTPDPDTREKLHQAHLTSRHRAEIINALKAAEPRLVEVPLEKLRTANLITWLALEAKRPAISQAALEHGDFADFADFLIRNEEGKYEIWLCRSSLLPEPQDAVMLCCYAEMFAGMTGLPLAKATGVMIAADKRVELPIPEFTGLYREIRTAFLTMQNAFTPDRSTAPRPSPGADHGRWTYYAAEFFKNGRF